MRFLFPEGTPNALRGCPEGARMLTGQLQLSYQDNISVRVCGGILLYGSAFDRSKKSKLLLQKKYLEISFTCVGLGTNSESMNENIFSHFRWSSKLLKILNKIAILIYA